MNRRNLFKALFGLGAATVVVPKVIKASDHSDVYGHDDFEKVVKESTLKKGKPVVCMGEPVTSLIRAFGLDPSKTCSFRLDLPAGGVAHAQVDYLVTDRDFHRVWAIVEKHFTLIHKKDEDRVIQGPFV